jgi:hypothetical protein
VEFVVWGDVTFGGVSFSFFALCDSFMVVGCCWSNAIGVVNQVECFGI